jgi:YHS domain-containing protein
MKGVKIVIVVLLSMSISVGYVLAGGDTNKQKSQTTCPVMGGKINKAVYADHEGKRVYFCSGGCIDEFKKDPEKYVKKLEDQGVMLEKVSKSQNK